jgi:hypothetical protein
MALFSATSAAKAGVFVAWKRIFLGSIFPRQPDTTPQQEPLPPYSPYEVSIMTVPFGQT